MIWQIKTANLFIYFIFLFFYSCTLVYMKCVHLLTYFTLHCTYYADVCTVYVSYVFDTLFLPDLKQNVTELWQLVFTFVNPASLLLSSFLQ